MEGKISILINDVILAEWERNKERCYDNIKKLQAKLQQKDSAFADISKYATGDIKSLQNEYSTGLEKLIAENEQHIQDVKDFINNNCIKIPISQEVKLKIYELSLSNEAPFHNKKNNVGDAAILLSSVEYLKENLEKDIFITIFVSNNIEEYTDGKNTNELHPQLINLIKPLEISFERVLPAALNISKKIISQMQEFFVQLAKHAVEIFTWDVEPNEKGFLLFLDVKYHNEAQNQEDYLTICVAKDKGKHRPKFISFILPNFINKDEGLFLFFANRVPDNKPFDFIHDEAASIRLFFESSNEETVTARIRNGCSENGKSGITVDVFQSFLEFDFIFFMYFNVDLSPQTILIPLFSFREQYTLLPE